jgi:hypothetical protein
MHQQEVERAQLRQEAKRTRHLIAYVQRRAEEHASTIIVATARVVAQTQEVVEATRQHEVRQARLGEDETRAAELTTETTRLAATQALAKARDQEHKMAVQVALTLKAQQDKERERLDATKAAEAELRHKEHVLEAAKEEN